MRVKRSGEKRVSVWEQGWDRMRIMGREEVSLFLRLSGVAESPKFGLGKRVPLRWDGGA